MQLTTSIALSITVLFAAACGDNLEAPEPGVDAGADVCTATADRNTSCRNICRADVELCAGAADWTICFEECRAGVADVAWCPGQRGQ